MSFVNFFFLFFSFAKNEILPQSYWIRLVKNYRTDVRLSRSQCTAKLSEGAQQGKATAGVAILLFTPPYPPPHFRFNFLPHFPPVLLLHRKQYFCMANLASLKFITNFEDRMSNEARYCATERFCPSLKTHNQIELNPWPFLEKSPFKIY